MLLEDCIDVDKDLEKLVRPKVEAFDEPAFALGNNHKLSGERSDAAGFKFLRLKIFGSQNIKTYNGCVVTFKSESSELKLKSDTKEIVSYYSYSLKLGITEFEVFLNDEDLTLLRNSIESITIKFKKTNIAFQITDLKSFNALLK